MTTTAIIQARMSSSRLPGKVIQKIAAKPMLVHVIERAYRASQVESVWVATTTDPSDDPLESLCKQLDIACFRGSMHDVLDRYYQAARAAQTDIIVRLTADCPLLDPQLMDATIKACLDGVDFSANRLPPPWTRSFPIGLDTEVCSFAALERAWYEAQQPYQREHVLPYIYEGVIFEAVSHHASPGEIYIQRGISQHGFRVAQLHHDPNYGTQRWTVDTMADLELVREIFSRLSSKPDFSWLDVLELFARDPNLAMFNAGVQHKSAFDVDSRVSS